ncbi:hypothetical protein BDN72DRAFT_905777 [Pluteus cervinus]|uniref:Uncharacterized protein n=1 Tax=Pluteus cervinus TaxID=181527 RepID=A0ACD3A3T7_9AGAR|nr:hypothetical protein BDN72DRAFT_905777 [Pluteus cervinus]
MPPVLSRPLPQSILEFLTRAKELLALEDATDFVRFVLTGRTEDVQAVLDPILNLLGPNDNFVVTRDYDSFLGFHRDIAISGPLSAHPISFTEDTLTANVHVSYKFKDSGEGFEAPLHKVQNLCLGKWGTHNMVRVFIPALYNHNDRTKRKSTLTQEQQAIFYEKGFRPAIEELMPDQVHEWPTTYATEFFRARARSGALKFTTKVIPANIVPRLGRAIRRALERNGTGWHIGLVFLHQLRGLKHSSIHAATEEMATVALMAFLKENNITDSVVSDGTWWIDVGLEISSNDGHCLAWRTDSHFHVVRKTLGINDRKAKRITSQGSTKYTRDVTSHLPTISGCRIAPGKLARGDYDTQYLQMYTTDKSLTYLPDGGHFRKFLKASDVLKGKDQAFIDGLYNVYIKASESNSALARIEVRVPINCGLDVLLNLDDALLRQSLVAIPLKEWWSFRAYRALAIKYILEWQGGGNPILRAKPRALLLTAGATWLLNSLHSTPDLGQSSRKLLNEILPQVSPNDADPYSLAYGTFPRVNGSESDSSSESEEDESETRPPKQRRISFPGYPHGAIFLDDLCVGPEYPVPRVGRGTQPLDAKAMDYFFGCRIEDIEKEFFVKNVVIRANPARNPNKSRNTPTMPYDEDNPPPLASKFHLSNRGLRLSSPTRDLESENDSHEGNTDDEDDDDDDSRSNERALKIIRQSTDINLVLGSLWTQFLLDLIAVAPNEGGAAKPSYCKLDAVQRAEVSEHTFKNHTLSDIFYSCRWKTVPNAEDKDWRRVFDHCWLDVGQVKAGGIQNYPTMEYFKWWEITKGREVDNIEVIHAMREALRERFDKLRWVPYAQSGRVWLTKPARSFTSSVGLAADDKAPQILVRRIEPTWVV